jgi:signal transduction histidine kinase
MSRLAQIFLRRTVRMRLTALYGLLFLVSGVLLLALTYAIAATMLPWPGFLDRRLPATIQPPTIPVHLPVNVLSIIDNARARAAEAQAQVIAQRAADLHYFLVTSGIALAAMCLASVALGWWAAGRVLRPLRTMTERARHISEDNLRERLAITGPDDEMKDLADTLDGLFSRLEGAFEAQRRFVANASHELRTPLARARTLLEVAMDDPDATVTSMQATGRRVLAAGEQQERLIDALLVLARSQYGLDRRTPFDLAALAGEVIEQVAADGTVTVETLLLPTPTTGDAPLVRRLLANLVDNAVRHNVSGGWVTVRTRTQAGRSMLLVANSGPVIAPDQMGELFEPFRRLHGERTPRSDGLGLGLSIVAAIAAAHRAGVTARPLPDGGLVVEISFPLADATALVGAVASGTSPVG